jgi:small ligand-binding sensory domain FIST
MSSAFFASALSTQPDSGAAIEEALAAVERDFGSRRPDLVLAFATPHHLPRFETLGRLARRRLGASCIAGATGSMLLGNGREIEEGPALSVWAGCLPGTRLRLGHLTVEEKPEGGWRFHGMPRIDEAEHSSLLLVADPFTFPASDFLEHLEEEHPGLCVFGGVASGGASPGSNRLILDDQVATSGALALVLEGGVEVRAVVSQGCRPIGDPFVITSTKGNLIKKLRGKGAAGVLLRTIEALPNEERELFRRGAFIGLAVDPLKSRFESGDLIVRQIAGLHPQEDAIAVLDDSIRPGMSVQFLVRDAASASADLERILEGVASDFAVPSIPSNDRGALLFTCTGRGKRMFGRADHDAATVQESLGPGLPLAGFFANGEIGPVGGHNYLHGFSATIALFRGD